MSEANSHDHSGSFSNGEDESPFFADITLDLAEAHDFAETPEPTRRTLETNNLRDMPKMPSIPDTDPSMMSTSSPPPPSLTLLEATTGYSDSAGVGVGVGVGVGGGDAVATSSRSDFETRNFASITSSEGGNGIATSSRDVTMAYNNRNNSSRMPPSARRWPRDVPWAVAFCIMVPLSLLLPMLFAKRPPPSDNPTDDWLATSPAPRLATLHTLMWGYVAALILSRLLYRTMGGGDGDDARHVASQVLLASAPISVSVYIMLIVAMYFMVPRGMIYAVIPLWFLARDLFLFRTWKMTATTPGGRQAFFQALTCMTLDILSRSLRRSSFYRIVSLLLVVQLVVIAWWRWALLAALRSHSGFWIVVAALGGKWATGTVARVLTLIASGGISSWFAEQNSLVEGLGQTKDDEEAGGGGGGVGDTTRNKDDEMIEFTSLGSTKAKPLGLSTNIDDGRDDDDEAYRTADASMYKSVLVPDEGMDDDFEDEEDDDDGMDFHPNNTFRPTTAPKGSNVKQLLFSGLSISFGSVAKCGLLGGMAQFLWSQLRKIDTARATFRNLQGMSIGVQNEGTIFNRYMLQINLLAREFVRNYSDMAMSHVAAFQKSYQRAAQDVAILIDESGVEPMIHEDISTHMSACVGGSVSGVIVIFTGSVLVHQRNRNHADVPDSAVLLDMLLAFIFCYTLIFTVMEPLRAAIKAVYVSFAQHPQALSQSYPLIYHRLSRMSQSNLQ